MNRGRKNQITPLGWRFVVPAIVTLLTVVTLFVVPKTTWVGILRAPDATAHPENFFSDSYPQSEDFQAEIQRLLNTKSLSPSNEKMIREWSLASAEDLGMPPAVLWCLFFQESRLNHLTGHGTVRPAKGLGQFLTPTFYEVNNHLDRFTPLNSRALLRRMGKDVRPVRPMDKKTMDLSSYYYIPTAVLASAGYLNNRYHQLQKNLRSKGITPDPDLLWLYSVMAYNKGTRSVLSFWNEANRTGGTAKVTTLVTDLGAFQTAIQQRPALHRALGKIWPKAQVERYAQELRVHLKNVQKCALQPKTDFPAVVRGELQ
jgi:hypothetical protein